VVTVETARKDINVYDLVRTEYPVVTPIESDIRIRATG
jgi:hypothetical protein